MNDLSFFENMIRPGVFFLGFAGFSLISFVFPYRTVDKNRGFIRFNNFMLIIINAFLQKALGPLSLIFLATLSEQKHWGLFNLLSLHYIVEFTAVIIFFDLMIYTQHLLTHHIPILWRLHRVHHTDIGFDTSTALRFHPLEIILSLVVKSFFIVLLGASPLAVFVFEALINFSAMFHHSNFSLPPRVEKVVSHLIVTPDIHRIHHSALVRETDSNFAFFISAWDRIFKTHTSESKSPQKTMCIGLETHRDPKDQSFWQLLIQPFK